MCKIHKQGLEPSLMIRKIVVRSTNWIGDAIMTTPALTSLRDLFPEAHITVAAREWALPVFADNPYVDSVLPLIQAKGMGSLWARCNNAWKLRQGKFDMALLFPNSFDSAFTAWLAGIPIRAGYAADMRRMLLDPAVDVPQWKRKRHEVFYYLNLVDNCIVPGRTEMKTGINARRPELTLRVPRHASKWAEEMYNRTGISSRDIVIGFNPGAAFGPAKCWPVENFIKLGHMLLSDLDPGRRKIRILVLGTDKEKEMGDRIVAPLGHMALNLAGTTDLSRVMAIIEKLDLLITNDSGLMHVGAALDCPLVALFGSTNPVTTGPWSRKSRIVRNELDCSPCLMRKCPSDFKCMKGLLPCQVYNECAAQLRKYSL